MKKLTVFSIVALVLAGATEVSASTWNITNQLDKEVCVTVNTAFSRIRRHLKAGENVTVKSKACLYSISVKEGEGHRQEANGKARCPEGLANIGKSTIFKLDKAQFDTLKQTGKESFSSVKSAEDKKAALGKAAQDAGKAIFGAISKACSNRDFIIMQDPNNPSGAIVVTAE